MAYVLLIDVVYEKVSETIFGVSLDVAGHVLPQGFMCNIL